MPTHSINYECPECKADHEVTFEFWRPDDEDVEVEDVTCKCGCVFEVECTVSVDYYFSESHPEIISSGIPKPEPIEFDPKDTSTWPPENDPNQLKLI